jgi:hypothetical protein
MALIIFGETRCALCDSVLTDGDDIVATTHFIADSSDRLYPYSDAALHRACFLGWRRREAFVSRYNATMGGITWGNGTYHEMQPDGSIISKRRGDG